MGMLRYGGGGPMQGAGGERPSVKRVCIESDLLCYGPEPDDGALVGQCVWICPSGRVRVAERRYRRYSEQPFSWSAMGRLRVDGGAAASLISELASVLEDCSGVWMTDARAWSVTLWDVEGRSTQYAGMLDGDPRFDRVSELIRGMTGRSDLVLFGCTAG